MAAMSVPIEGMHCQNCVNAVTKKLQAISGVESVQVSLDKGEAVLQGEGIDADEVVNAIEDLGFDPGEVTQS